MPLNSVTITTTMATSSNAIVINIGYLKTIPGALKLFENLIGFLCWFLILYHCYNYYDPYYQKYSGFGGGKSETAFLLIAFTFLMGTLILLVSYMGSIVTATIVTKTTYELIYHLFAFSFYIIISLTLLIEVANRNRNMSDKEPGFGGKITASTFGIINSFLYLLSALFSYQSYKHI